MMILKAIWLYMAIDVKYIEKHGDIWRTYDGIWRYLMVFTRNTYDYTKKIYADVQIIYGMKY